jgi:proteasome lid subunit RPN8/RPN11
MAWGASIYLILPPAILRRIKEQAKSAFPKETYGLLLGTVLGDHIHVDDLHVPDDVGAHATPWKVFPQAHWFADAIEAAEEMFPDTGVVGFYHSHPYAIGECGGVIDDRALSEADIDGHPHGLMISGICVVQEFMRAGGRRILRASVRFWAPLITVKVTSK